MYVNRKSYANFNNVYIILCFILPLFNYGKFIHQRLEFLEKFSANNFALSDAEDNTSRPLNRGCTADLPLLRTLLAICQKFQEPNFWEVMDSLVLLRYASLVASRTLLQQLLAVFELNSIK